jgi:hypothetical protein
MLGATSFAPLTEPEDVAQAAREIIESVNGAMRLQFGDYKRVTVCYTARLKPDGGRDLFARPISERIEFRSRASVQAIDANGNVKLGPQNPVVKWVRLAETDRVATEILWLISLETQDWFSIYKIHELIQEHGGFNSVIAAGLTTRASLDSLTATANNFSAAGRAARHANLSSKPMKRAPMSLSDATELVRLLAVHWLNSR